MTDRLDGDKGHAAPHQGTGGETDRFHADGSNQTAGISPPEHRPAVDRTALETIASLQPQDSDSLLRSIITLYLDSSTEQMREIRSGAEARDAETLRRAAHTLKSPSGYLGAMTLLEMCREMEALAKTGALDGVDDRLAALEKEYGRVRQFLTGYLDTLR